MYREKNELDFKKMHLGVRHSTACLWNCQLSKVLRRYILKFYLVLKKIVIWGVADE